MHLKKILSLILASVMLLTVMGPASPMLASALEVSAATDDSGNELFQANLTANGEDSSGAGNVNAPPVYQNGVILLYSFEQLQLVGSDAALTDADAVMPGSGTVVSDNAKTVLYSPRGTYRIAADIALPSGSMWRLPQGFSGAFVSSENSKPLYEKETDTIYICNPYQLETMAMSDAEQQPVLSQDADAATFGTGKPIYPNGEDAAYLTYSPAHHYVISKAFTYQAPKTKAARAPSLRSGSNAYEGRDFAGQVIKKINGETYILIGNAQQLRAIGTNEKVRSAIYIRGSVSQGYPILGMGYGGDADLLQSQNGTADYAFGAVPDSEIGKYRCGVDQETGEINGALAAGNNWETGEKYSTTANYIIFRDIDLNGDLTGQNATNNWTPLMFSGKMYGAKSVNGENLWDGSSITDATEITALAEANRPVISNVVVNQTADINVTKYIGVGFFATITNEINRANIGVSAGTVVVKNIELTNVAVSNSASGAVSANTLVSALTSSLGWLVGGLVDVLGTALTFGNVRLSLRNTLSALLNARTQDPTIYSTGAFAGRIVGDVLVEDCAVTGSVQVSSTNHRTGGFVGYTDGMTEYSGLSQTLGTVVDALSSLLNVIPGLGLGDLITILLENALPLSDLIPTAYINPILRNNKVSGLTGTLGSNSLNFIGGFVGQQIGTRIENSTVTNSTYTVNANTYGGGFAGITRDAQIRGTLTDVGIDLMRRMQPQSLLLSDSIQNSTVTVQGVQNLGGFTGTMCSSYAVNCSITGASANSLTVSGSGSCVGGFTGLGTVGWFVDLGKDEIGKATLLGTVRELLVGLLSSNPGKAQQLLSLAGVAPSAIMGLTVNFGAVTVSAGGNYAGGVFGRGDGIYFTESSAANLQNLSYWRYNVLTAPTQTDNTVVGLSAVAAGDCFAGGICGLVGTANITGLLNNTLGVGEFIGFHISNVSVQGVAAGYSVSAVNNYAGGGIGEAVGGAISNVTLLNLASVSAANRVGGFVGCAGPGDLAGTGGLALNLLGLNMLQVNNLLAVGQGVEVEIDQVNVHGLSSVGFTVAATGAGGANPAIQYTAAGFIAKSNSTKITNSHVYALASVTAPNASGYSGGFIGTSECGGLADVADENSLNSFVDSNNHLLDIDGLLNAVSYLIPQYTNCTVTYTNGGYVAADIAGGFVADLQSGKIDNTARGAQDAYAVYNIDHVTGQRYGGGFGGRLVSGALASASKGLSILGNLGNVSLDLTKVASLISLVNAYVPFMTRAGVFSANGFTVQAMFFDNTDLRSGSAGGFAGYTSGAQISYCDVMKLKKTTVTPPSDLEAVSAPSYYNNSAYSVSGAQYAGGYAGFIDIGSAASLGKGLSLLGQSLLLDDVLDALNVVVTTIEHSEVQGMPGGFSVLSTGQNADSQPIGSAGGFAGQLSGGHIQDSHAVNFSYIIGEIVAGGYVGKMEPGDVASALGETSILSGLIDTKETFARIAEDFVPTIRNSTTSCIPCGGAVRANSFSDNVTLRGMAGGYVGYNHGGNIWGMDYHTWKEQNDGVILSDTGLEQQTNNNKLGRYIGEKSICAAYRIYSVYGCEYAGGYTGLMDCGDTASTGSLHLLFDLVKVDNLLGALSIVYPTEENTAVYGPLSHLDYQTWNTWVEHIGKYGGYGSKIGPVNSQEALNAILADYVYGYNVVAGRSSYELGANTADGGCAGGHTGAMISGTITNGQSFDVRMVKGMKSAGGYIGDMRTGGAANLGSVSLLNLPNIDLGALVGAVKVFVPVIKTSTATGYQSGMTVIATGSGSEANNLNHRLGSAGGYVGASYGGQIWGDDEDSLNAEAGCNVVNLKKVQGVLYTGGFSGLVSAASVADVNTNMTSGLLQDVLNTVIRKPSDLLSLIQATIPTVRKAAVSPADSEWGFTVEGYQNTMPLISGGFVGSSEAGVFGSRKGESNLTVTGLRGVAARQYAGGFIGLGDVGSVASVSGNDGVSGQTSILSLIQAGEVSVLDAFRTYIYYADVTGAPEGYSVLATAASQEGILESTRYTGCAGGFGGGILNGSVKHSSVSMLNSVEGVNYAGGFIGHLGKNGTVDVDNANVAQSINLLGATAGVLDVFGSHVDHCTVTGRQRGYTVKASGGDQPVAGGFVGYGDLSKIDDCHADRLKTVESTGTAGGFIGLTAMNYIANVQVSSVLLQALLTIVNFLVRALYLNNLQNLGLIDLGLGDALQLKVLSDGDLLYVNLLGLRISAALSKASETGNATDVAIVTIGDSSVALPCNENGLIDPQHSNLDVHLIKGNRSNTTNSSVTGISVGYDVFADETEGYAGGFVGCNNESVFENNEMIRCDEITGAAGRVGPFSGSSSIRSVYYFNTLESIEGDNNVYHIYRDTADGLQTAVSTTKGTISSATAETVRELEYSRFDVTHLDVITDYADFENAYATPADENGAYPELGVYVSSSEAVLMLKRDSYDNPDTVIPENSEMQYPCEDTIDFTINKSWNDNGDSSGRPDSITVKLYQTNTRDGSDHATLYGTYTLSANNEISPFTDAVWTLKIENLPAQFVENDVVYYYTYSVTETPVSGYSSAVRYTDDHYTANIVNTSCDGQAVVVDYGLPMSVTVLEFLKIKSGLSECDLTLRGVAGENSLNDLHYKELKSGFSTTHTGEYGSSSQENNQVAYTLGEFKMPETDLTAIAVQVDEDGRTTYVYSTVTFIPATLIYYEDNELSVTYSGNWTVATDDPSDDPYQDEDRPSMDKALETIDQNNIYGYDSAYEESVTYGLGSAHKVNVSASDNPSNGGAWPYAEFTFTGSGFDIIGVSSGATGTIRVQVFNVASGAQLKSWIVDTYYGYTREEAGFVRYTYQKMDGQWDVQGRIVEEKGNDETGLPELNQATPGVQYVVYEKHYQWTPTANQTKTLYQVPVISSENELKTQANPSGYGTYRVRITPMYSPMFDHQKTGSYDFYLDGIRIYNPVADEDQAEYNANYYLPDLEGWPSFFELRDSLIDQQLSDSTIQGLVFIDHIDEVSDASDYKYYGPNNEIYLSPGQSISFEIEDASSVSSIQISAKRITEEAPVLGISFNNQILPDVVVNSSSEMYYKIIDQATWEAEEAKVVTITNKSSDGAEVSIVKMKITHDADPSAATPVQLVVNQNVLQLSRQMAWTQYATCKVGKMQTYVLSLLTVPTNTQQGMAIATCAETGNAVQVALPTLDAAQYTVQITREPTCTEAGKRVYSFEDPIYGQVSWTEPIEACGHDFEKIRTENGMIYQCRVCHFQKEVSQKEHITNLWLAFLKWIIRQFRTFFAQFIISRR